MVFSRTPRPSAPTISFTAYQPKTICRITYDSPPNHNQIQFSHKRTLHQSFRESLTIPILGTQDLHSLPQNNNAKRKSNNTTARSEKVVGKNILRPSHKPITANMLAGNPKKQLPLPHVSSPGSSLKQWQDKSKYQGETGQSSFEAIRKANQKLREMKLSESIQPIVHPYRDKSTDSYHYGHRHLCDEVNQSIQTENIYSSKPITCQESLMICGHDSLQMSLQMTSKLLKTRPSNPTGQNYLAQKHEISFISPGCVIKQDLQGQKQSKEIAKYPSKQISSISNKSQKPEISNTKFTNVEQKNMPKVWEQRQENSIKQISPVNESEAEKCGKIRYLYEPYSMNLSSNHKNQNNFLYQSDQQTPKSKQSRTDRIKAHETTPKQMEIFEDEDKWDKILRIRQQSYRKTVSRQQSGDSFYNNQNKAQDQTAAKTDVKNLHGRTLQQFKPYTTSSYQSSNVKQPEKQGVYHNMKEPSLESQDAIKVSDSTNKFYDKLQEIVNHYKPNPDANDLNKMKYSYSFEQTQEVQFRTEKDLFSKLLSSTHLEWMLVYSQMIAYAEETYDTNKVREGESQRGLVDFVKIGEGQDNQIMCHYIGIWLMWMGYEDRNVKERVLENVELMFMNVDDIIAQDHPDSSETDPNTQHAANIRSIAEIMYNHLLYGYLPEDLQMQALIQTCRRGWQYFTFLICRLIKLFLKLSKRKIKKINEGQEADPHLPDNLLYLELENVLQLNL